MEGLVGVGFGMILAWFIWSNPEVIISDFKNPTCIEKHIAKEKIIKCYKIVEVKNESR